MSKLYREIIERVRGKEGEGGKKEGDTQRLKI